MELGFVHIANVLALQRLFCCIPASDVFFWGKRNCNMSFCNPDAQQQQQKLKKKRNHPQDAACENNPSIAEAE